MNISLSPGDVVAWTPFCDQCREHRGTVTRIEDGRVFVAMKQANTRGRKVTRTVEVWFDEHETERLRKPTP